MGQSRSPFSPVCSESPCWSPKRKLSDNKLGQGRMLPSKQNNPPWLGKSNKSELIPNFAKRSDQVASCSQETAVR